MIAAIIILGMVMAAVGYLIVVGGNLKKAEYLEAENENIHTFNRAVHRVDASASLQRDPNNRDSV